MSSEQTTCQTCLMVHHIKTIQKNIRKWQENQNKLKSIVYRGKPIIFKDINVFFKYKSSRSKNDLCNKKREDIIACIINNKIPEQYFKLSQRWNKLKNNLEKFIKRLCQEKGIIYNNIKCIPKAGRGYHYDFEIVINDVEKFKVEFKFNTSCVNDTPQFVSPMKPSQYLETSYEKYYYNTYLIDLVNKHNLPLPTEEEYLKYIHSTSPMCMKEHQEKYYKGCKRSSKYSHQENDIKFYKSSKKTSHDSIKNFISKYDLNKDKLTEYLSKTQKNKYYMLYKHGKIYLENINSNDYTITEITKDPEKNRYIAKTKSNINLKILLRWKNGNGIAYPAFQIS